MTMLLGVHVWYFNSQYIIISRHIRTFTCPRDDDSSRVSYWTCQCTRSSSALHKYTTASDILVTLGSKNIQTLPFIPGIWSSESWSGVHWITVGLMLGQRQRQCPSTKPTVGHFNVIILGYQFRLTSILVNTVSHMFINNDCRCWSIYHVKNSQLLE